MVAASGRVGAGSIGAGRDAGDRTEQGEWRPGGRQKPRRAKHHRPIGRKQRVRPIRGRQGEGRIRRDAGKQDRGQSERKGTRRGREAGRGGAPGNKEGVFTPADGRREDQRSEVGRGKIKENTKKNKEKSRRSAKKVKRLRSKFPKKRIDITG